MVGYPCSVCAHSHRFRGKHHSGLLAKKALDMHANDLHIAPLEQPDLQADECALVKQQPAADQCRFVQEHCVSGWTFERFVTHVLRLKVAESSERSAESLVNYFQLYYCHIKPAGYLATCLLQVACVFTLLLLFRVLGSTAENFFSPILTQLSQELGLPPRLAGGVHTHSHSVLKQRHTVEESRKVTVVHAVTFLALGNGAPDISSSIAAVRAGQYKMALGSLLGKLPMMLTEQCPATCCSCSAYDVLLLT